MATRPLRVLLVGASGLFGRGIAQGLVAEPGFEVLLAGRQRAPLDTLVTALSGTARSTMRVVVLDVHADMFEADLRQAAPDLLVHCAGPFQGADYRVAATCLKAGIHYVDLADAREFVAGIETLDESARAAGRFVLSGASTVPALSGALVRALHAAIAAVPGGAGVDATNVDLSNIDIDIAISPGNRTDRGIATVRAILGYCGKVIPAWRHGAIASTRGWFELRRVGFAPLIGKRWQSAVDLPDIALLPKRFPGLRSLTISAGLELSVLHLGLSLLSGLARWRLFPLASMAVPLKWCSDRVIGFGTDTGGMRVVVGAVDAAGRTRSARFDLVATGGVGPRVPTLASIIIAKRLRDGVAIKSGARPADQEFHYTEFEREWTALGMRGAITVDRHVD